MQFYTNCCVPYSANTIVKYLLMTKFIFLLTCCCCMALAAPVRSQEARVTMRLTDASISKVFRNIEKNAPYKFVYNSSIFSANTKVSIDANNETVANILTQMLQGSGFTYRMLSGDLIVITREPERNTAVAVTGIVTDEKDNPLPGLTVTVKGQTQSQTSTNNDGRFTMQVPGANATLIFSYVGFATQEVPLNGRTSISVKMKQVYGALNEVLVVGYGQQTKATLTGSVSAVSGADLAKVPAPNITQSLAGRLPGLIAYSTSGRPGADNATLLIRGLSTTGDNSPLIVIDGIPRSNFDASGAVPGTSVTVNALSYLDPNDIESISILKDAAATAVYGARAANGAILVTTKRGTEGAASITYTGNVGSQRAAFLLKPLDSYTSTLIWNQAWKNEGTFAPTAGGARGYTDAALEAIRTGSDPNRYANTDWHKTVFGGTALQTSHNLSVSGGGQKNRYFVSGGYFNQEGIYKGVQLKRYNIRSNLDGKVSNRLDYSLNLSGRVENNYSTPANPQTAFLTSSLEPVQYTNGTYHYVNNGFVIGNPLLDANGTGGNTLITNNFFESSGSLSYKVPGIEGLTLKGTMAFDKYYIFTKSFRTPYITYTLNDDNSYTIPASVAAAKANLSEAFTQYQSLTYETSLNYNHSFKSHNITALLLYTQTQNRGDNLRASRTNFASPALGELNLGSTTGQTNGGTANQNARQGVVGRVGYNFKNKYLAEFAFRYDGSDLFPASHRFGFFPAVSAGWRLSEEDFIKKSFPVISNLKVRASWGQAGNDRAGAFQYLNTYSVSTTTGYSFGGAAATAGQILTPNVIANTNFTWEKATTTNVGLEFGLWGNLLGATADYFYKRTSNVLASNTTAIPVIIGGTVPVGNYGTVDNSGFEIQLTHENTIGSVNYFLRPNVTFNRSKVVYYPDAISTPNALKLTGKPVSPDAVTGYVSHGFYQSQDEINSGPTPLYPNVKPGDLKYEDTDGDGKITANDRVFISRGTTPGMIFGLNGGASYKNFDVNFLFQGAADTRQYITNYMSTLFIINANVSYELARNYWTPDNPNATFPRPTITSSNNKQTNSYWVRDASYVRLKSLELGYKLPTSVTNKLGIGGARFFLSGTNLFTLSHLKNIIDPENLMTLYPLVQVYNVGVSVKF